MEVVRYGNDTIKMKYLGQEIISLLERKKICIVAIHITPIYPFIIFGVYWMKVLFENGWLRAVELIRMV